MADQLKNTISELTSRRDEMFVRATDLKHMISEATMELEDVEAEMASIHNMVKEEIERAFADKVVPVILPRSSSCFMVPGDGYEFANASADVAVRHVYVTIPDHMTKAQEPPAPHPEARDAKQPQPPAAVVDDPPTVPEAKKNPKTMQWAGTSPAKSKGSKQGRAPRGKGAAQDPVASTRGKGAAQDPVASTRGKGAAQDPVASPASIIQAKAAIASNLHLNMGYYRLATISKNNARMGKSKVPVCTWGVIKAPRFIREAHPWGYCAFAQAPDGCTKEDCKLNHCCILCNQDHGAGSFVDEDGEGFQWCCEVTKAICDNLDITAVSGLHKNKRGPNLGSILSLGTTAFNAEGMTEAAGSMFDDMFK